MAHTTLGELAQLIQGIEDLGLPTVEAMQAKLTSIYEMAQTDAEVLRGMQKKQHDVCASEPYAKLRTVLDHAYHQASAGKGKDRHVKADGQRFEDQPICTLQRLYGRGYAFGQAGKKMEESERLPYEQARAELLGGIVYLSAAVVTLDEDHKNGQAKATS